ncbi:hypothetical protein H0H81_006001 [Sphagnurus paluster]|uniref:DUF803-domain-containing protein n=1 Tax=Sphagnurus paluster TaxID=117069 RepID=A0A9P7K5M1_9AGAR|nr:hypothetical protein H0H81_006001 [Sphagnurus paluster]
MSPSPATLASAAAAATTSSETKTLSAGTNLKVCSTCIALCPAQLTSLSLGRWYYPGDSSVIIALNGPAESSVGQIRQFQKLFLAPGFLAYASVLITTSIVIVVFFAPKYGTKSMMWYISVCSMIGGISVSVTTGLGAAIVQTALGDNQFKYWFMYFLLVFVVVTLLTEVYYLNKALALFNTAMVTPTYYVIFTFFSILTTIVLFQGLKAPVSSIITLVMGFLVICVGIVILQMSKVDPASLAKLDRRSTILLQAARSQTEGLEEKDALAFEDPGMDALRGSFGTVGSIIRARSARRMSQSSNHTHGTGMGTGTGTNHRLRPPGAAAPFERTWSPVRNTLSLDEHPSGLKRHQLYDAPMPPTADIHSTSSVHGSPIAGKRPTIKFDSQDVVHQYERPGTGDSHVTEHRRAVGSPVGAGYPPLPGGAYPRPEGLPAPSASDRVDLLGLGIDADVLAAVQEASSSSSSSSTGSASANAGNSTKAGSTSTSSSSTGQSTVRQKTQTLLLPTSRFTQQQQQQESGMHSAPATFARAHIGRGDARDLFGPHSGTSTTGTLLSFPSVTDSARSQLWEDDHDEMETDSVRRGRTEKRYPKGAGDDDREESVSLWQRAGERRGEGEGEEEEVHSSPASYESPGGIRLVTPQTRNPHRF